MQVSFDFTFLIAASVSVVGVVEWLKGFLPISVPTWVYRAVLLPVSAIVAVAAGGSVFQIASNVLAMLAVTQISYPVLVQLPGSLITVFKNRIGG